MTETNDQKAKEIARFIRFSFPLWPCDKKQNEMY